MATKKPKGLGMGLEALLGPKVEDAAPDTPLDASLPTTLLLADLVPGMGHDLPAASRGVTERAKSWFVSSFPLLGGMVAAFTLLEDAELCRREEVMVAAVDETLRRLLAAL